MRMRLLPSKAELRREHSSEIRRHTWKLEGLLEEAKGIKRDLAADLPDSRDAQARLAAEIEGLEAARWFALLARKVL